MAIDLNTAPFYDDFDKAKKFYRILFKPGRAVQARELTQLQTILQNQIEAHGSHIFKNGSIVNGGRSHVTQGSFLQIASGNIDVFVGKNIIGSTSGATGYVTKVSAATTINNVSYSSALYLDGSTNGIFEAGETITISGTTTSAILNSNYNTFTGPAVFFNLDESIFYIDGYFAFCDSQTVVISKTFSADPSARIGLSVVSQVVSSDDDVTLLDPAIGTNNYFAPGADRLKIDLILSSIEYDPTVEGSDQEIIKDFVDLANMRFGELIKLKTDADYNLIEDALAKRTYDESGDYTVKPFIATPKSHLYGNIDRFTIELSPGKAYVKGYGFETIVPTNLSIDKARDYNTVENFPVSADYGRYTDVLDVNGFLNQHSSAVVDLHNNKIGNVILTNSATYSNTKIGSAKIRYVDHVSSSPDRYRLYLYDLSMNTSNTFGQVKSFVHVNSDVTPHIIKASANTYDSANVTVITYGINDTLLVPVPQKYVKTFQPSGSPTISFTSKRLFENVSFSHDTANPGNSIATISVSGAETFSGSAGDQSDSVIKERYYSANTTGHVLDFTGANGSIELDAGLQLATLRILNGNTFTANVSVVTVSTQSSAKTKTLTTANVAIGYSANLNLNTISLNYPDVVSVSKIEDTLGNSYIGSYLLDIGQRDDYYDHGALYLSSGSTAPVLDAINNPELFVTFSYMAHSGASPFFTVDSYTNSGVSYGDIPDYITSVGRKYNLADVLDFRPVRAPNSNALVVPRTVTPESTITGDYQFYLARADKIVVSKDKSFNVIRGQSAIAPEVPADSPDAMTIYTVSIPPYTKSPTEVKLGFVENRRFTMRDIGKIEKRIDRIEYYTTLSFLEKIAADQKIASSVPGVDRFKNGILVDPFSGHGVGDIKNGDYICSIDNENRTLRPAFATESLDFTFDSAASSNVTLTGDLITPEYVEIPYISQIKATRTVNLTPYEVFDWVGQMHLSPSTDTWCDTTINPSVIVNVNGENDAFSQIVPDSAGLTPWATRWNSWQSVFRGVTDVNVSSSTSATTGTTLKVDAAGNLSTQTGANSSTSTTTGISSSESLIRSGMSVSSQGKVISSSAGTRIVDASIVPYIRSRVITFVAKHLKPNTEMFAVFDNIDVTQYCNPAVKLNLSTDIDANAIITSVSQSSTTASGNVILQKNSVLYIIPDVTKPPFTSGTATLVVKDSTPITRTITTSNTITQLQTSEAGDIAGTFTIPNNQELRFNVGERQFKLVDSLNKTFVESSAQTTYLAHGLSTATQETILSTKMNLVSINPIIETKQEDRGTITKQPVISPAVSTSGEISTVVLPSSTKVSEEPRVDTGAVPIVISGSTTIQDPPRPVEPDYLFTLHCGQSPKGSGKKGVTTYKINLGSGSLGQASIVCTTGEIPDNFTLNYRGIIQTSGFITTSTSGAYKQEKSKELVSLGEPSTITTKASGHTFNIYKQTGDLEYAYLTVNAPFKQTGWKFSVNCPTGSVNPAPGAATISIVKGHTEQTFVANYNYYKDGTLRDTPATKHGIQFKITNKSNNPTWKVPGDGVIRVASITVDTSGLKTNDLSSGFTTGVDTTGTGYQVYSGVDHGEWNGTITDYYYKKTKAAPAKQQSKSWSNTLGTLPVDIPKGESRTFTVWFDKLSGSVANGRVKVVLSLTNSTGTQIVAHEDPIVKIKTKNLTKVAVNDPIAQTFFVDSVSDPNGVFITSIDAWFAEKSNKVPVRCEIRPVVNGYPSSTDILPYAATTVDAEKIKVSSVANVFNTSENTRFVFPSPVYCAPGQYAVIFIGNDHSYRIYTAVLGEFELGSTVKRVAEQPYIGSMFKSQNSTTWVAEQYEDITFRINRASFDTSKIASVKLDSIAPVHNVLYDVFYTQGETLSFPGSEATYGYKRTDDTTGILDSDFISYQLGTNVPTLTRKIVQPNTNNSLQLQSKLYTGNEKVAPVIDIDRLSSVLVQNIINNDATGEDSYSGGNAEARYMTRRVTLAPGFEAQDLKVYVDAFCPTGTSFKVYYKVNAPGTTQFDTQNKYVEMMQESVSGNTRDSFAEYVFENPLFTLPDGTKIKACLPDGSLFNTFVIKIVMLSSNPALVPIFKDLRVLALDDY